MTINEKNIQENIPLANHTTFRIGGPAKYFVEVNSAQEIKDAILWAKEKSMPYFILGGGSNLLVSDKGFEGIVIKIKSSELKTEPFDARSREAGALAQGINSGCKIIAEAGVPLIKIILKTAKNGYSGAEWGFGIPGTIGGAICGNAHRLGQAIAPIVESVEILDSNLENKILQNSECEFDYGESRFKKSGEIILSANLIFKKQEQKMIDDVLEQAKAVVRQHPPFPSAGCVFRNYKVNSENDVLLQNHPELASRARGGQAELGQSPAQRGGKIGVGYLIDQCGLKGRQVGGAKIWEGHANYIVNTGGAKASDVVLLINLCKKEVKEKYSIVLEEEIRFLEF